VLINNAGFGGHGKFVERDLAAEQAMMQVNMVTLTNLTHHYLKGMVARRRGRILNVSSTASFVPGPLQAVYYATKAYVTSFTQAIAEEVREYGVTATVLCPGAVATGFVAAGDLQGVGAWKNAKSAESVARCGYAAMERGELVAFNERKLRIMLDWIVPLLPRKAVLKMSRQAMEKAE
jgi:short-subunit dehydrogenase